MKSNIIAAIEKIAGNRLNEIERDQLAIEVIRIMEEYNKQAALTAIKAVKEANGH